MTHASWQCFHDNHLIRLNPVACNIQRDKYSEQGLTSAVYWCMASKWKASWNAFFNANNEFMYALLWLCYLKHREAYSSSAPDVYIYDLLEIEWLYGDAWNSNGNPKYESRIFLMKNENLQILYLNAKSPKCYCTAQKWIWKPRLSRELHYIDVIMSAMASQITSFTIVYSTVYSGVDQRKHQSSASLAFVGGNTPVTGEILAQRPQRTSKAEKVSI